MTCSFRGRRLCRLRLAPVAVTPSMLWTIGDAANVDVPYVYYWLRSGNQKSNMCMKGNVQCAGAVFASAAKGYTCRS